jgi:AraC-like DNA-binding protein
MQLIRYRPQPPLERYIECFWWSRRDHRHECEEHMLPSGSAQLVFALHEELLQCRASTAAEWFHWAGGVVHGTQLSYYVAGAKPAGCAVGIAFRAGAAGAVMGLAPEELTDHHVPVEAIWGPRGIDLHQQLMSAAGAHECFRILERTLSARVQRPLLIHPAVAHALAAGSTALTASAKVGDLQRSSGYSPRHFNALFRAAVGLNPKHYYRIQRFNYVARAIAANHGRALSDIAAAAGYSDQAHLTREFREFAGVAPTQYRPAGPERALHHGAAAQIRPGGR